MVNQLALGLALGRSMANNNPYSQLANASVAREAIKQQGKAQTTAIITQGIVQGVTSLVKALGSGAQG